MVWVRSQTMAKRRGNGTEISTLCRFFLIEIKVIPTFLSTGLVRWSKKGIKT